MELFVSLAALDIDVSDYGEDEMDSLQGDVCAGIRAELEEKYPDERFSLAPIAMGSTREGRKTVLDHAANWNQRIQDKLITAMSKIQAHITTGTLKLDTFITYELAETARMADDGFSPYGRMGIFRTSAYGAGYFKTVMDQEMAEDIAAHPEQYAIIAVCAY